MAYKSSLELQKWTSKRLSDQKKNTKRSKNFFSIFGLKNERKSENEFVSSKNKTNYTEFEPVISSIEKSDSWEDDWLDNSEVSRVRQMFRIPEKNEFIKCSHCTINSIVNKQMFQRQGTICLFRGYLCFFEFLPQTLKDMIIKEGFLAKYSEGSIRHSKNWLEYYFVLDRDKLAFYENLVSKEEYTTIGVISLQDIHSVVISSSKEKPFGFQIMTSSKQHFLACEEELEAIKWVESIKKTISRRPNYSSNVTALIPLKFAIQIRNISTSLYPTGLCVTSDDSEFFFSSFCSEKKWKDFYLKLVSEWETDRKLSKVVSLKEKNEVKEPLQKNLENFFENEEDFSSIQDCLSDSEKLEFQQKFRLPESEMLISVYKCAMLRSILVQGKMYISTNYICFYSRNLGHSRTVIIPFRDVVNIGKQKFQAHWLVNAIIVTTMDREFNFGSFLSRQSALDCLKRGCKRSLSGSAKKLKIVVSCDEENFGELEVIKFQKKKITMLVVGTRGDVQPFLALALGLQKVGHSVRLATHEAHRKFIVERGVDFYPLAGDPKQLMKLCVDNPTMFSVGFARDCRNFLEFVENLLLTSWEAVQASNGSDVIIQNPAVLAGPHIAEKLNIPIFIAFTFPWSRTTEIPHSFASPKVAMGPFYNYSSYIAVEQALWLPLVGKFNTFRKEVLNISPLDISSGGSLIYDRKIPHMYCWSPSVLPKPTDWPEYLAVTGYWFLDTPKNSYVPPQDLVDFIERKPKPIYIGFGSVNVSDPDRLSKIILKSLIRTKQRAVVMKTWGGTDDLTKYPDIIYVLESTPHDWLFPKMAAVVHHGGAGTTAEGIRAGIPTMIVPFFGDQFLWASRIEELGVGIAPFSIKKINTFKFSSSLQKLVSDEEIRKKSEELGQNIRSQDGLGRAIEFFHKHLPIYQEETKEENSKNEIK